MHSATRSPAFEAPAWLDRWTALALLAALLVRPLLYSALPIGREFVYPILSGSRLHWWAFHGVLLAFQWLPFALVWLMLSRTGASWRSLGVDWSWFVRHRFTFAAVLAGLIAAAVAMPGLHYETTLPAVSQTIFMAPVSTVERLFILVVAASAGICEEILYRGLPLTRLTPLLRSGWIVLPITLVSFVYIHGDPDSLRMALNYIMAGLAFGVPFLMMKQRRLEVLMVIHFAIDASMIFAP